MWDYLNWKKVGMNYSVSSDLEKDYDVVDWEFLLMVLKRKGFRMRWIRWMRKQFLNSMMANTSSVYGI